MDYSHHDEHILVCVNHGQTGIRLIRRGLKLALKLEAPLTIMVFGSLPEDDEHDKIVGMPLFKKISNHYGAELIMQKSESYKVNKLIADRARTIGATQIIISQMVESIWRRFLGNTTLDGLLKDLPHADVRVVPKHKHDDINFEHGMNAYLHGRKDGTHELAFHHDDNATHEGVFYKHLRTDFNNGRFVFYEENDIFEVRVLKGHVPYLENISEDVT
ncbi:universal stress protein UspA [Salicibibacter halophilus]|uniref:Universal stress protein UspA n=1 Tax=Salicibibacter halophilus TaxID=2502791 RepID=A0A514LK57_9BACI|nr:universal stress protein UspA [Salicibibacter halophilus]QDI92237.1 universal stress protein UspA [Salicibibacter halophilus]